MHKYSSGGDSDKNKDSHIDSDKNRDNDSGSWNDRESDTGSDSNCVSHRDSHIEVTMAKTDGGRNSDLKRHWQWQWWWKL